MKVGVSARRFGLTSLLLGVLLLTAFPVWAQIIHEDLLSIADTQPGPPAMVPFPLAPGPLPIELSVTSAVEVTITGGPEGTQTRSFTGGGHLQGTDTVHLTADAEYTVVETYSYAATVESVFLSGTFELAQDITWTFVAPKTANHELRVDAQAVDFEASLEGTGPIAGKVSGTSGHIDKVGDTVTVNVQIKEKVKPGKFTFDVTFGGSLKTKTTLNRANKPPTIDDLKLQPVPLFDNMPVQAVVRASDPDGDPLTFEYAWKVNGNPVAGVVGDTLDPANYKAGDTIEVTVKVSDGVAAVQQSQSLKVESNSPPQILARDRYMGREAEELAFTIKVEDDGKPRPLTVDDVSVDLSAFPAPKPTVTKALGSVLVEFKWTPPYSLVTQAEGSKSFPLKVKADDGNRQSEKVIQVVITHVGVRPVLQVTGDTRVDAGKTFTLDLKATDKDGNTFRFDYAPSKSNAAISIPDPKNAPGDAVFTWDTTGVDPGNYNILFTVKDGDGLIGSQSVTLTVGAVNRPPVVEVDPKSYTVPEGGTQEITFKGKDPDGDPLTLSVESPPTWLQVGTQTGAPANPELKLTARPGYQDAGTYAVALRASDGQSTGQVIVTIIVTDVNQPPTWAPIPSQLTREADIFQLDLAAYASDPDPRDTRLVFSAENLPDGAALNGSEIVWRPDYDQAGEYQVDLTVSDGRGGQAKTQLTIGVQDTNRPPTLEISGQTRIRVGESLDLTTKMDDPDKDNQGLKLVPGQGPDAPPAWITLSSIKGTPTAADVGVHQFKVGVVDKPKDFGPLSDKPITVYEEVVVVVEEAPKPPPANAPVVAFEDIGNAKQQQIGAYWGVIDVVASVSDQDGDQVHLDFEWQRLGEATWHKFAQDDVNTAQGKQKVVVSWSTPKTTGRFQLRIQAKEIADQKGKPIALPQSASVLSDVLLVDNEAPPVPTLDPIHGPLGTRQVRISGSVDTSNEPLGVEVTVFDTFQGQRRVLGTTSAGSPWALDIELPDGRHVISAKAVDKTGAESGNSAPVAFFVDTTDPTVDIREPKAGNIASTSTQVNVLAGVTDVGSGLDPATARLRIVRGGVEERVLRPVYNEAQGTLSAAVSLVKLVQYTLIVEIADRAGRVGSDSVDVVLNPALADADPPNISIQQPSDGSASNGTVDFEATVNDTSSGVDPTSLSLKVFEGSTLFATETPAYDASTGLVQHTLTGLVTKAADEAQGFTEYRLVLEAKDKRGNQATAEVTIRVDTVDPKVTSFDLRIGNTVLADADWTNAPSSVNARIDGESGLDIALTANGLRVAELHTNSEVVQPMGAFLSEGFNTIGGAVRDGVGNLFRLPVISLNVDTVRPLIVDYRVRPVPDFSDLLNPKIGVNITGRVRELNLREWRVEFDGQEIASGTVPAINAFIPDVQDGAHTLRTIATDFAGNEAVLEDSYTMDRATLLQQFLIALDLLPPEITFLSPDPLINESQPVVNAIMRDPYGEVTITSQSVLDDLIRRGIVPAGSTVPYAISSIAQGVDPNSATLEVRLNDVPIHTYNVPVSNGGEISFRLPDALEHGKKYDLVLSVRDFADNLAFLSRSVRVDTRIEPAVTLELKDTHDRPLGKATTQSRVNVSGRAEPGATVALVRASVPLNPVIVNLLRGNLRDILLGAPLFHFAPEVVGVTQADAQGYYAFLNVELQGNALNYLAVGAHDAAGNGIDPIDALQRLNRGEPPPPIAPEAFAFTGILVDTSNPRLFDLKPTQGSRVNGTVVSIDFSDNTGLLAGGSLSLDGVVVDSDINDGLLSYDTASGAIPAIPHPLSEGIHTAVAIVRDLAGNVSRTSWDFLVDQTAPNINLPFAPKGDVISNTRPRINIAFDDNGAGDIDFSSVELSFDGVPLTRSTDPETGFVLLQLFGQLFFDAAPGLGRTDLAAGDHTLEVSVKDTAGNVAQSAATFTVDPEVQDQSPPVVLSVYPGPGSVINTTALEIMEFVLADADSGTDFDKVIIELNGQTFTLKELIESQQARRYHNRVVLSFRKYAGLEINQFERGLGSALAKGPNTVRVVATDFAGNTLDTSWSFTVQIDPPAVPTLDPIPSPTRETSVTLTGKVAGTSPTNPVSVVALVNGLVANRTQVKEDGSFEVPGLTLVAGSNEIHAYAVDVVGNQSELSESLTVVLDEVAPTVTLLAPLPGTATNTPETTVQGSVDDPTVTEVTLLLNGKKQTVPVTEGAFSQVVTLVEGANTLQVIATDAVGNEGRSDEVEVTLITQGPKTAPEALTRRLATDAGNVALSWSADPNAASYNIYRDTQPITSLAGKEPLLTGVTDLFATDTQTTAGQTYYYAVTSVDRAGNEGTTFTTSPGITLVNVQTGGTFQQDGAEITFAPGALPSTQGIVLELSVQDLAALDADLRQQVADADATAAFGIPEELASAVWSIRALSAAGGQAQQLLSDTTLGLAIPADLTDVGIYQLTEDGWRLTSEDQTVDAGVVRSAIAQLGVFRLGSFSKVPPYDVNADGTVDILDLTQVGLHFGETGAGIVGDVNQDGTVDILDLTQVGLHFGEATGQGSAAPGTLSSQSIALRLLAEATAAPSLVVVNVLADAPEKVRGFQVELTYDANRLELVRLSEGQALSERGSTYWLTPATGNGRAQAVSVLLGKAVRSTTSEQFVRALFRLRSGTLDEALRSVRLSSARVADASGLPMRLTLMGTLSVDDLLPSRTALRANFPNPFNPETWIPYELATQARVTIEIFNARGEKIRTLDLGVQPRGRYLSRNKAAYWDGRTQTGEPAASGVYFYTLKAGDFTATRKMVILK